MLYRQSKHLCQAAVDSTTWSGPRCAAGSDLEGSSLCSVGSAPGLSPPVGVCQLSGTRFLSAACHAASLPPPASAPVDRGCGEAPPPGGSTWVHMRVQLQGPLFLSCLAVASPTPAYRSESTAQRVLHLWQMNLRSALSAKNPLSVGPLWPLTSLVASLSLARSSSLSFSSPVRSSSLFLLSSSKCAHTFQENSRKTYHLFNTFTQPYFSLLITRPN